MNKKINWFTIEYFKKAILALSFEKSFWKINKKQIQICHYELVIL